MTENQMTEDERKAGVYVEPHLDFHDRGCIKRYGAVPDSAVQCECERRRAADQSNDRHG